MTAMPAVKLCGIHSLDDMKVIANSGVDLIGFVFAESKRKVTVEQVRDWLQVVDIQGKKIVFLFVHPTIEEITDVISIVRPDIIQLHGNESADEVKRMKQIIQLPIYKAIHHDDDAIDRMKQYSEVADGFVIDTKTKKQWGGTGTSFNWSYVPLYVEEGVRQQVPVFIAGGITPQNVDKLLQHAPFGIDLSSGVEEGGKKSSHKVALLEERLKTNANDIS